ncbi:uncharacterized protein LOC132628592 [Lycium barbarum]|uniref:uncharacterized protein LOC132628592 n=1 Tax=Lycium barbarum TaxID=112863 RepID=UPI00293F3437|nr:uncharacterized protein LOC132628592 [Lycium barbarum]
MSVLEYNLRFNFLARYAPAVVTEMEDQVHRFVSSSGLNLINDRMKASLQTGMDIFRIQAYAQNHEECRQQGRAERENDRGHSKRAISSVSICVFKGGQRQQYPRNSTHSVASAPPQFTGPGQHSRALGSRYRDESGQMRTPLPRCKYAKLHAGQCRLGSDVCYAYGQPGHIMRECPSKGGKGTVQLTGSTTSSSLSVRPSGQVSQTSAICGRGRRGASSSSGPQNYIYIWASRQDLESSPNVVTGRRLLS